ncbi:MAG: prepilin-type N-terminal cleavage/methylation domain-containing protein [Planctomycetota bacterium]
MRKTILDNAPHNVIIMDRYSRQSDFSTAKQVRTGAIKAEVRNPAGKYTKLQAFTLVELLVVITIIAILLTIMLPVFAEVKYRARTLLATSNKKQIVNAVICYAISNHDRLPQSVATIGVGAHWHWQEPTMIIGYQKRSPKLYRSMSTYLGDYITCADMMFSPNAPEKYKYLRQAWQAGESWDNPDTPPRIDPVFGSYCFYWNYVGYLTQYDRPFIGPGTLTGCRNTSRLLLSDYFGYGQWRSPDAYGSSEYLKNAQITPGSHVSSAYWSRPAGGNPGVLSKINVKLNAAYIDGHVSGFTPLQCVLMEVAIKADGMTPYPEEVTLGRFFLPRECIP